MKRYSSDNKSVDSFRMLGSEFHCCRLFPPTET